MIFITGYVGSGKSTVSKKFKECIEFDDIENMMRTSGYNFKNLDKKEFKKLASKFLRENNIKIIEGVQATDYYKKGDKVYFVKTGFIKSMKRSIKRDGKQRFNQNFKDNILLFFKLKILYIKTLINKDIIKDINKLK